ncbi:UNVERIFIED_CONTAM: hypothetical protein FKN15_010979 [Acipenser sinensis]
MNRSVLVPLFLVLLTGLCRAEQPDSSLLNEEVKRTVDLSSHLAKITADITVSNPGASAAQSFLIALDPELQSHLAYIGVIVKGDEEEDSRLELQETTDAMKIHYENNAPFLTITDITRTIEVSHWGNIAVEETVDLRHTGAMLKGPFSRYDYQRQSDSGISSIKSFTTILPAAAQDVYYRDEIGNISTSHLLVLDDSVEMEIRPRFPLFGGWKTHYMVGYNLPSYEYLYNLGDQYALKMRLVDHVFDDQVIDSLTVKLILPEGARNIQVDTPYSIQRDPDDLHYTYLDTFGRPVVVAHKKNLVEQHIQDVVVHYNFNKILMLQEPLLVVGAFYILFFTVIVYVRLDFSITKDPAVEVRMKVASITEQVLTLVNKRLGLYRHFDEVINKYKQSRDMGALNSGRKTLEAEHRTLTNEVASLQSRLKAEGSDLADKVRRLPGPRGWKRDSCSTALSPVPGFTTSLIATLCLVNKRLGLYRHFDEVINKYKQSRDMGALNSGRKTLEAEHRTLTNEVASLQSRLKAEGSDLADKSRVSNPSPGGPFHSRFNRYSDIMNHFRVWMEDSLVKFNHLEQGWNKDQEWKDQP